MNYGKRKITKQDKKILIGVGVATVLTGLVFSNIICGKIGGGDDLSQYALENIYDERIEKLNSLKKLIELDSDDALSHYEIGKIYNELQQFKEATKYLVKADRLSEKTPLSNNVQLVAKIKYDILTELSHALSKQQQFTKAIRVLERAKKLDPQKTNAYNKKGNIHDKKKEHKKAKKEYQRAKKVNRKDPEAYRNIANQAFRENRNADALSELRNAVRNNPRSYKAFENLGDGYKRIKNFDKAINSYQRALELKPPAKDRSRIYYKIAQARLAKGDRLGYEKNLRAAANQGDYINSKASEALGDIARENGKIKKALDHYKKALTRNSRDENLRNKYQKAFNDLKRQRAKSKSPSAGDGSGSANGSENTSEGILSGDEDLSDSSDRDDKKESSSKNKSQAEDKKNAENISKLIAEGKEAFKDKQYAIAEKKFAAAQDEAPSHSTIDYLLARAQDKLKKDTKAIINYKKAIAKKLQNKKLFYHLGLLYYRQGKYSKALNHFSKAIKIDSQFVSAHYSQGLCYDKLLKNDRAVQAYKKSLYLKPNLYQGHFNLGISYKKAGKYTLALNSFSHAEKINSDDPNLFYQRGELFAKENKISAAQSEYEKAIHLDPKHYEARFNLALLRSKSNQKPQAKNLLNQLQKEKPEDPTISYQLGIIAEGEKNYELAISEYQNALKKDENYYKAHLNIGGVYSKMKNFSEAENAYKKALELNSAAFEPSLNLGNIYFRAKNYAKAKTYYDQALLIRPHHVETRLAFAQSLEKLGFYEKSKRQYLLILKKKPSQLLAMEGLAFLYHRKLKDKNSAKNAFQKIINRYPNHPKKKEYEQVIRLLSQ